MSMTPALRVMLNKELTDAEARAAAQTIRSLSGVFGVVALGNSQGHRVLAANYDGKQATAREIAAVPGVHRTGHQL